MNRIFIALTLVAAALLAASAPAAAQAHNGTHNATTPAAPTSTPTGGDCTQHIDEIVSLCSADLEDETAVLVLTSDRTTDVVVTDAGAVMRGGEVPRDDFFVDDEGRTTIRFPVTIYNGQAAVTLDTGRTLWAEPLKENTSIIGGPWSQADAQIAAVGGALSVSLVSIVLVWRRITGADRESERIA